MLIYLQADLLQLKKNTPAQTTWVQSMPVSVLENEIMSLNYLHCRDKDFPTFQPEFQPFSVPFYIFPFFLLIIIMMQNIFIDL